MAALGRIFGRRRAAGPVEPAPLVVPRQTLDGWVLDGTPLARSVPRADQRELAHLLHSVSGRVDTPWTYSRAAEILLAAGDVAQAHAVTSAWLRHPASRAAEHAAATRSLTRTHERVETRLASAEQPLDVQRANG
ncbi:hypothetical protein [Motilibacter deserti]|uniref:Bacterial transcriptional activator domain-containing protein n=1 Tax=Motilibacter deserti TaxID=2714956 RepID=A0ABX0GUL2_9ACTN|nr:hypothetical protein [Motilibacter deserti]NHC13340.1 hypothetical protein [Motilibacter deserti]